MNGSSMTPPGPRLGETVRPGSSFPGLWMMVLVFALALRLLELGHQNLWCDEVLTVTVSHTNVGALADAVADSESGKPPLYFLFMHYWLAAGESEFWLRLPSAVFGALACVVALYLGREIFGEKFGWVPAVILSVLPFHVYYSQETRMYALLTLTGGAAMLFAFRFCRTQRWSDAWLYFFCAVLSCYVFTYGIFLIPFSCLLSLAFRPRLPWKSTAGFWMVNVLAGIAYIPWMFRLFHVLQTGHGLQSARASAFETGGYSFFALGLGTTFGPSTEQLRIWGKHVFAEDPAMGALFVVGLLIELAVLFIGCRRLWNSNRNAFFFVLVGLAVFWGFPLVANMLKPGIPNNPRYNILAVMPITVALAGFVQRALEPGAFRKVLMVLLALCLAISLANNYFNPGYAREDVRSAARYVEALTPPPGRLLICADIMKVPWNYYYHGPAATFPFAVRQPPVQDALKPLSAALNAPGLFGLVYMRPDYGDPRGLLPEWLEQHYHLESHRKWTGVDVYIFDGPGP